MMIVTIKSSKMLPKATERLKQTKEEKSKLLFNCRFSPNCHTKQKLFFKKLKNKSGVIWFCQGCNSELTRPKWYFLPVTFLPLSSDISLYLFQNDKVMGFLFTFLVIIAIQFCIYQAPIRSRKLNFYFVDFQIHIFIKMKIKSIFIFLVFITASSYSQNYFQITGKIRQKNQRTPIIFFSIKSMLLMKR